MDYSKKNRVLGTFYWRGSHHPEPLDTGPMCMGSELQDLRLLAQRTLMKGVRIPQAEIPQTTRIAMCIHTQIDHTLRRRTVADHTCKVTG